MSDRKAQFKLVIRDSGSFIPTEQRLKRLLKTCLRAYGFKCLECRPVEPSSEQRQHEERGE